ncbi:glycosyltransferase [Desulfosporosinus burensis]
MKVLLIDVNCKYSSTGKIVYDLYSNLSRDGNAVTICYGRGPRITETNIYKFSSKIEVCTHAILTRLTGLTGCYSFFATQNLIKCINKFKPDVVHIHELHGYFVNIAPVVNYLKKSNIKTIWTFHCEFMYTGRCGISYNCERWKSGCGRCPNLREYPSTILFDFSRWMFKNKKKLFDGFDNLTIATPSKWLSDRVGQSFLKNMRVEVIYNGIDAESIFYPRKFQHLKEKHNVIDEKIVLAVAPSLMSKVKGGSYIADLAEQMKGENIKFFLIGVEHKTEEFEDNVIVLPCIENQVELAEYYSMADVFVMCSERETFSLTSAEALCCGTQIVAFECGAPEGIFENPFATFVKHGDVYALKNAVMDTLNNPLSKDEVRKYGANNFSTIEMYKKYLILYKN